MVEPMAHDKQHAMLPKLYMGVIAVALLVSLLFVIGIVYHNQTNTRRYVHMAHLMRLVSYEIQYVMAEDEQGHVVRTLRLADENFKQLPLYEGQTCDDLFVLAPTTRGGVYLLKKDGPRRIIAWSKHLYEGRRLILWSDFSIAWIDNEQVDLIARTARETSK